MLEGKRAYICSPLSAPTQPEIRRNMIMAREHMKRISAEYHCRAFAPHANLPELLDDNFPEERAVSLSFGLELLAICDVLIICGDLISSGMQGEIQKAKELGKEIFRFCWTDNQLKLIRRFK